MLLAHTPATGFEIGARGIEGVQTARGTMAKRAVVDAAGAWARVVAAELGAVRDLPARFAGHALDEAEPPERCWQTYATHYRAGSETPAGP